MAWRFEWDDGICRSTRRKYPVCVQAGESTEEGGAPEGITNASAPQAANDPGLFNREAN